MAKTTQEMLVDSFAEAAGSEAVPGATPERLPGGFAEAAGGEGPDPTDVAVAAEDRAPRYAEAVTQSSGAVEVTGSSAWQPESGMAPHAPGAEPVSESKASGGGVSAASVAETVLESGLGMIPLIGGLIGLFSGGDSGSLPPLIKYVMPPSLDFQAADSGGGLSSVSYDQMGDPRAPSGTASPTPTSTGGSGGAGAAAPQTTTNNQTLDSRWFMDHSADIAAAVRYAMLNLNSINDVVSDL